MPPKVNVQPFVSSHSQLPQNPAPPAIDPGVTDVIIQRTDYAILTIEPYGHEDQFALTGVEVEAHVEDVRRVLLRCSLRFQSHHHPHLAS